MFVSDDGQSLVLITNEPSVWLWEGEASDSASSGRWYPLPSASSSLTSGVMASPGKPGVSKIIDSNHSHWTVCFFSTPVCPLLALLFYSHVISLSNSCKQVSGRCLHLTLTNHTSRSLTLVDHLIFLQHMDPKESSPSQSLPTSRIEVHASDDGDATVMMGMGFPFPVRVQTQKYSVPSAPVDGDKV